MKKIILLLGMSLGLFAPLLYAQSSSNLTVNTKASATLASSCLISSQNVGFGQIVLPVSNQSASSNMIVQCSKNAPYTIGLAYGGIYGTTTQQVNVPYNYVGYTSGNGYLYNYCNYTATYDGVSYNKSVLSQGNPPWFPSCPSTNGTKMVSSATVYNYGKMIGSAKGDNIAYSIQVPNNPTQVWNAGNYSYSSTGIGSNQTIPITATLVPSQTTNQYPSADIYLDVVTATITY